MTEGAGAVPATRFSRTPSSILPIVGLGILMTAILWQLVPLLIYLKAAVFYPYSLDYGEGIVWQQMRDMIDGTAYAPLQVFPAIVYHYPPVYHLTSALVAAITGMDQLVAGRMISILSTFTTAVMVGMLTMRAMPLQTDARIRRICAILAGLLFLTCLPVMAWAALMRVDMLSGALALAGILLALRALDRPAWIYGAAAIFLLSVYTKQVSIAAPIATFSVLLLVRPKVAIHGIIASVAGGLLALAWLSWVTNGGFLTHILIYNLNRYMPEAFAEIMLPQLLLHVMLIVLSIVGAVASIQEIRRNFTGNFSIRIARETFAQDRTAVATLMLLIFFALKTIMLAGILKSGATINYMIEWFVPVAIFAAIALGPLVAWALGKPFGAEKFSPVVAFLFFVGLPSQLFIMPAQFANTQDFAKREDTNSRLVKLIASSNRPVISDDMTLIIRAGKKVEWEAAIAAELGALGEYDQAAFIDLVHSHCFGFFVIEGPIDNPDAMYRYNRPVAQAILSAYPYKTKIDKFSLLRPSALPALRNHCPLQGAAN